MTTNGTRRVSIFSAVALGGVFLGCGSASRPIDPRQDEEMELARRFRDAAKLAPIGMESWWLFCPPEDRKSADGAKQVLICGRAFRPPTTFGVGSFDGVCIWDYGPEALSVSPDMARPSTVRLLDASVVFPCRTTINRRFIVAATSADMLKVVVDGNHDDTILAQPAITRLGAGLSDIVLSLKGNQIARIVAYSPSVSELLVWHDPPPRRAQSLNIGSWQVVGVQQENGYSSFKVPVAEPELVAHAIATTLSLSFGLPILQ